MFKQTSPEIRNVSTRNHFNISFHFDLSVFYGWTAGLSLVRRLAVIRMNFRPTLVAAVEVIPSGVDFHRLRLMFLRAVNTENFPIVFEVHRDPSAIVLREFSVDLDFL